MNKKKVVVFAITLAVVLAFSLSASAATVDINGYDYQAYLHSNASELTKGDTLYVDVMLYGNLKYTQFSSEIAYDNTLLTFAGYENLQGWVAAVCPLPTNKISVRSMPSMNMVFGEPCSPEVQIVTLKFTVKETVTAGVNDTALSFASLVIGPPAGVIGAKTAPTEDMPIVVVSYKVD
ncbi:MAG: hypothetical protein FWG61_02975 [Firmicutes bacterium]|nr:hypothetical protein [Bacillota bacterium]